MAVSLSGIKSKAFKEQSLENLQAQAARVAKKEKKRKGWSSILGSGAGLALGYGIAGALGVASGGLLLPLILGASGSMAKKWTDEATKKAVKAETFKADQYGYGTKQAKQLAKQQREIRDTGWSVESLGQDIAMSYLTAGLEGNLGDVGKGLKTGGAEGRKQMLGVTGEGGWQGAKSSIAENLFGIDKAEGAVNIEDMDDDYLTKSLEGSGLSRGQYDKMVESAQAGYVDDDTWDVASSIVPESIGQSYEVPDTPIPFVEDQGEYQWFNQEGGRVPQMNPQQLMQLLSLAQMQQQEMTYDNTPLEEEKQQPTISEYFASQGKTLGGNNTKSLSQILGR